MTPRERDAMAKLRETLERKRLVAECPCVRSLLVILSDGLDGIASAEGEQREDAPERPP